MNGSDTGVARLFSIKDDLLAVRKISNLVETEFRAIRAGGVGEGVIGLEELVEFSAVSLRHEEYLKKKTKLDSAQSQKEYDDSLKELSQRIDFINQTLPQVFAVQFRASPDYLKCLAIKEVREIIEKGVFSFPTTEDLRDISLGLDVLNVSLRGKLKESVTNIRDSISGLCDAFERKDPSINQLSTSFTELRAAKQLFKLIEADKLEPRLKTIPKSAGDHEVAYAPELDQLNRFTEVCEIFRNIYPGIAISPDQLLKTIGDQIKRNLRIIDNAGMPLLVKGAIKGINPTDKVKDNFSSNAFDTATRKMSRNINSFSRAYDKQNFANGIISCSTEKDFLLLQDTVKALAPDLFAKADFKSATQELLLLDLLRSIEDLDPNIKARLGIDANISAKLKVLTDTLIKGVFRSTLSIDREIDAEIKESRDRFTRQLVLSNGRLWGGVAVCSAFISWGTALLTGSYGGDFNAFLGGGGLFNALIAGGLIFAPMFLMQRGIVDPVANKLIKEIKRIPEDLIQKIVDVQKDNVILWQDLKSIEKTFKTAERSLISWLEMLLPEEYIKPVIDKWNELAGSSEALLDQELKLMDPSERKAKLEELSAGGGSLPNIQEFLDWLNDYLSVRPTYGSTRALAEEAVPGIRGVLKLFNVDAKSVYQGANISELLVKRTFNNLISLKREYAALKYPLGDDFIRGVAQRVVKEMGDLAGLLKTQRDNADGRTLSDMLLARWAPAVVIADSLTFGRRNNRGAQQT